jgi:hypothetical protein
MSRRIETSIEIDSPPADVWAVLTDTGRFDEWNPFVRSIEGRLEPGSKVKVRLQPAGKKGITLRPTIKAAEAPHELRWLGRLGLPRLFDGEHQFVLEPLDGGRRTRFIHAETFRGVLVPLLGKLVNDTRGEFESMNLALRERVAREVAQEAS